jgi:hypothetical protein
MSRLAEVFLHKPGQRLADYGFIADPGQVERTDDGQIVFYHYTQPSALDQIFAPGSGLRARLPVVHMDALPELRGCFLVEGLLEPLPQWLTHSPYFGDLGFEFMRQYVGTLLLQITLPANFPGLYVAEAAHNFECKHVQRHNHPALDLGYDCGTGQEVCIAEVLSYIPLTRYLGGYVAPNVKAVRAGSGIAIPRKYLAVCETQPLAAS